MKQSSVAAELRAVAPLRCNRRMLGATEGSIFEFEFLVHQITSEVVAMNSMIFPMIPLVVLIALITSCHRNTIHFAVGYQEQDKVKEFVESGTDINARDGHGNTPLLLAAQYNIFSIGKYLIEKGADVDAQNRDGWTALIYSSYYENLPLLKTLVSRKANLNLQNNEGWTALNYAVYYGRDAIAKILIENKADVNKANKVGYDSIVVCDAIRSTGCCKDAARAWCKNLG
jgi:ankyrin repeat protein